MMCDISKFRRAFIDRIIGDIDWTRDQSPQQKKTWLRFDGAFIDRMSAEEKSDCYIAVMFEMMDRGKPVQIRFRNNSGTEISIDLDPQ
jgi:hypothetical protein